MRYAVISDLHANEQALRHTLDDIARQGADRIVCLGDVVGYGPLPVETVALARRRCDVVLAGNHDDAVSGRGDASSFINLAGDAVERHRDALSREDRAWLASLPYTCELEGAVAAHGDVADPEKFYYVDSPEDAVANFNATDAQLVFVGHTHEPAIFVVGRSGTALRAPAQDFTIEDHKRYIVNPGSVGYPREAGGECHSSYVIYDSSARTVTFRYLPFS
ncbi:MAG: metallophosphoesterase family protein, partial [Kiritimatiellae bacterium]|nr:metallophosphoesterase family protein [Kiritimatiellia bacterium]